MEKLQKWVAENHIDLQQDSQSDHAPLPERTRIEQIVIELEHLQQVTVGILEVGIVLLDEDPGPLLVVTAHSPGTIGDQEQDLHHVLEVLREGFLQEGMMTGEQDLHPEGMTGTKGIYIFHFYIIYIAPRSPH